MSSNNPIAATEVDTLVINDTSANALVVGGAVGATSGTGGIKSGAIVSTGNVSDSVGTIAAVRAGGIGIASQVALDFISAASATQLARLAKGTGLQYPRMNAAATAWEFINPSLVLIGESSGTNTTAAAANVATFALSGLTVKDTLRVIVRHSSAVQTTAAPVLYHVTDSVTLFTNLSAAAANLTAATASGSSVDIGVDPSSSKAVLSQGTTTAPIALAGGDANAVAYTTLAVATTDWTGAWTLALRTGAGGVTAGGTYSYHIAVYRLLGQ